MVCCPHNWEFLREFGDLTRYNAKNGEGISKAIEETRG